MMSLKKIMVCCLFLFVAGMVTTVTAEQANAETKIGVMNVQKVIALSKAGQNYRAQVELKVKELQQNLKADENRLLAFQQDIEKKSSVWSEEVKTKKIREFNKAKGAFKQKTDDANFELTELRKKGMEPLVKQLEAIVEKFCAENGYDIVLNRAAAVYVSDALDISAQLAEAFDNAAK